MALYLVTGGAGFIGSNLSHTLVAQGHRVRIIDDFSTGHKHNISSLDVEIVNASICDPAALSRAFSGVDVCLHQAAIPSVPRSVKDPLASSEANIEGSLGVFLAARDAGVRRVVIASSSSVYGKSAEVPTREDATISPISPYAVSKASAEMYARVCSDLYDMDIVCLRYFNVFGPRQDPHSDYAAVIPKFVSALSTGTPVEIHGDGGQSRDFSYIDNVVHANLLAGAAEGKVAGEYNIALGQQTSVQELFEALCDIMGVEAEATYTEARAGDIRTSMADISKARETFGYTPEVDVRSGLEKTVAWLTGAS